MMKRVSVIIPTKNRAERLRGLLICLSRQTVFPSEVVVVDNGSTDETRGVARSFKKRLPLRYILEKKRGPSFARNAGIKNAKGELLVFLDDDCLIERNFIKKIQAYNSFGEKYIFGFKVVFKFKSKNMASDFFLFLTEAKSKIQQRDWPFLGKVKGHQIVKGLYPSAFFIKKKSFRNFKYCFNENFFSSFGEGPELNIRAQLKGFTMLLLNNIKVINLTLRLGYIKLAKKSFLFGVIYSALKINFRKDKVKDIKVVRLFRKEIKTVRKQKFNKAFVIFFNSYKKYWQRQSLIYKIVFPIFSIGYFFLIIMGLFYGWLISSFYYPGRR